MKTLVVYYSRTGNTKTVGKAIAKELKADSDEIIDLKKRLGKINWLIAGRDAMRKKLTKIKTQKKPESYDMIIIGTPYWGGNIAPAVRTYLKSHDLSRKKVGFFCTSGGDKIKNIFEEMKKLAPKSVAVGSSFSVSEREMESGDYKEKVKSFAKSLKK